MFIFGKVRGCNFCEFDIDTGKTEAFFEKKFGTVDMQIYVYASKGPHSALTPSSPHTLPLTIPAFHPFNPLFDCPMCSGAKNQVFKFCLSPVRASGFYTKVSLQEGEI